MVSWDCEPSVRKKEVRELSELGGEGMPEEKLNW